MTSYPGREVVTAGVAVWTAALLYVLGCLVAPSLVGTSSCELAPGSSVFGEASRSWLPPGTTCTYDVSSSGLPVEVVTTPSPLRLVVVAVVLIGPPVLLHLRRLLRRGAPVDV